MNKIDLYENVTNAIVQKLEAGTRPWRMEWNAGNQGMMPRRVTGEHYRGINILLLWGASQAAGYAADTWMTFNQAIELGGAVRKGERSTQIVFFKPLVVDKVNSAGETEETKIPLMRSYNVFNVEQIDGLPARYYPAPVAVVGGKDRDQANEAALRSCGADIREGGGKAYYHPSADYVQMPDFDRFNETGGYLATLAHELCHWSGHKSRLDRDQQNRFGSKDYAFEELVAEIGAAFIGARLGIVGDHIDNHAAYVAGWLQKLRDDKRAIFRAAAMAQTAADLVLANADQLAPVAPVAPVDAPAAPVIAAQYALAL